MLTLRRGIMTGLLLPLLHACSGSEPVSVSPAVPQIAETVAPAPVAVQSVVAAVNVGGPAYSGFDGVEYAADIAAVGGRTGTLSGIKGSQDPQLFETYRVGDIAVDLPLANGIYDITFLFAELDGVEAGERVFDIIVEDRVLLNALDVRVARDNKTNSNLDRTAIDAKVEDGELTVRFNAKKGEPILSGFVVRKKMEPAPEWKLVWSDEFDYEGSPDPQKWTADVWPARKVNDEDQAYTDRLRNTRVENGMLILEAHREDYDDAKYTSGRIHSQHKGDLLYGRIEARARVPAGRGTWAAIWMLPTDPFSYATLCSEGHDWQGSPNCDAWPNSGEIDILEHVGYDMQIVHGTVHTRAYYWKNWEQRKASIEADSVDKEFRRYALEWSPERIDVFYEGTPYFSYINENKDWKTWPFDKPFHLILNLAIGGAWGRSGGPIDDSIFPVRMEVDYVRFYQLVEH